MTMLSKIIGSISLQIIVTTHAMISTINIQDITPDNLDDVYNDKNKIFWKKFYEENKWKITPLILRFQKLTKKDKVSSLTYSAPIQYFHKYCHKKPQKIIDKYTILHESSSSDKKNIQNFFIVDQLSFSEPNKTTFGIDYEDKLPQSNKNQIYLPYVETLTNNNKYYSQYGLHIEPHIVTIATITGKEITHIKDKDISFIQGALTNNDNELVLLGNSNSNTYMRIYTCGYTPEELLCIIAYNNGVKYQKNLKELLNKKLFKHLLQDKNPVAQNLYFDIVKN